MVLSSQNWGRRPKHDDFDDLDPVNPEYNNNFIDDGLDQGDEENEEINLDNPDFQKGEMWNDYADDMEFEE